MARKREDSDPNDSTDVSLPPEIKRAQIDQLLRRAVPKTPEWLKKNGAESRGADFAHYAGAHEPKASDDTVEQEPAVVLDETKRDVLNLSPEEIERIRMRRESEAKRNESTFSASLPKKSRMGLIVLGAVITIVIIALLVHMTGGAPSTVPTTATSATTPPASASIEVPPVPTVAETASTVATSSASVATTAASSIPTTTSATPMRPIKSAGSHSTAAPSATPTTSASSSGVFFPHI